MKITNLSETFIFDFYYKKKPADTDYEQKSGKQDLNLRPLRPERSALPS